MQRFLKIATQMFPAERIESINRNAQINGELGIEVKLFGIPEVFQYTGQYASLAYDVLEGTDPAVKAPAPTPTIIVPLTAVVNGVATLIEGFIIGGVEYRFVNLTGQTVNADDLEWVDFASAISPTEQGIEVRVATDLPGVTRKFVGANAEAVYDVLVVLASNQEAAATN